LTELLGTLVPGKAPDLLLSMHGKRREVQPLGRSYVL